MTKDEIAKKIAELITENKDSGTPWTTAGGLAMLKQYKRILNDVMVLLREVNDRS